MEFMKNRITKSEAKAFRTRWKIVNNAEQKELRSTSADKKFEQLVGLMSSVEEIGWTKALATEEKEVRNRWNKLRRRYHV
jgi:NADH dehydrogenase/NADH:ubiquinone oxidoreductase subunit G